MEMFRDLTPTEVITFEKWATINHKPGNDINTAWHPVIQSKCQEIDEDAGIEFSWFDTSNGHIKVYHKEEK